MGSWRDLVAMVRDAVSPTREVLEVFRRERARSSRAMNDGVSFTGSPSPTDSDGPLDVFDEEIRERLRRGIYETHGSELSTAQGVVRDADD